MTRSVENHCAAGSDFQFEDIPILVTVARPRRTFTGFQTRNITVIAAVKELSTKLHGATASVVAYPEMNPT
jgi:hypothetical protein